MSDTSNLLDDALDRLLSRRLSDDSAPRAPDLPERLYAEMLEAGFTRVLTSEAEGGLGGTLSDAAAVAWRCGWHAAPVPIVEMLLLAHLEPGVDPAKVALAHGSPAIAPALPGIRSLRTGSAMQPAEAAQSFRHISGADGLCLDGMAADHDPRTLAMGALLTSAAMTGVMARTIEIITDHATTRRQFGRPLSKFQAIQHQLAEAKSELTVTEAALANALQAHDAGAGRALFWQSAKAQAGTAATKVAATAHQVMGAMGFTEDHPLHHFTKLLWQWRDCWGRQVDCERAIGQAACAAPNGLWPYITELKEETV